MDERAALRQRVIDAIDALGFGRQFGALIADELRTEYALRRMLGYLKQAKPRRAEDVADELVAIDADRSRLAEKKLAERSNAAYHAYLWNRRETDPEA